MSNNKIDISAEAITWAYQLFLDRPPENETIVKDKLERIHNTQALRKEFLDSEEFISKGEIHFRPRLSGDEPPMAIEQVQSPADLEKLYLHIQRVWEHLGETEPHWSVLSAEAFKQVNLKDSEQAFYNSGRKAVEILFHTLERNGIDPQSFKTCLEYGCGLGRVTRWLAEKFTQVYGYDISRSHLQSAGHYLENTGIKNVSLHHLQALPELDNLPKVDVVYTIIVLQHNPPPIIARIVAALIACLNPGGVAFFQIPTYHKHYRFSLQEYLRNEGEKQEIEMHVLPQSEVLEIIYNEGGQIVEVLEDSMAGAGLGIRSNSFVVRKRS